MWPAGLWPSLRRRLGGCRHDAVVPVAGQRDVALIGRDKVLSLVVLGRCGIDEASMESYEVCRDCGVRLTK